MEYSTHPSNLGDQAMVCVGCGAVVWDTTAHDRHHAEVALAAARAEHATYFTETKGSVTY